MSDNKQDQIIDALMALEYAGLANPPAKLPEFFALAARSLEEFPVAAIRYGIEALISREKFFPRIVDLREAAEQGRKAGHYIKPEIMRARATQHLADKNPITWTEQDHAEFERWYGHPVFWKGAPIDTGERCPKCGTANITFHDCAIVCGECGYEEPAIEWEFKGTCVQAAYERRELALAALQ